MNDLRCGKCNGTGLEYHDKKDKKKLNRCPICNGSGASVLTTLYVNHDSEYGISREKDPNEEWDRDDTWSNHYVTDIYLNNPNLSTVIHAKFPVQRGDVVYLIWCQYSTGDSFGHDEGGGFELLSIFKDKMKAEIACKVLEDSIDYTTKIINELDCEEDVHCPWHGYFESLDKIVVEEFTVL